MFRPTLLIARYTLLEALRNRLMLLMLAAGLLGLGFGGFLHDLAITEPRQMQLAPLAALLRLAAVFFLATFIVTSMAREYHDKGLELLLSLPLPRAGYLLGKLAGFAAVAAVPAVLFGLLLACLAPYRQAALWTGSLLCELWLVAAFSLLCTLTLTQVMLALSAVTGFYLLARSISALQTMSHGVLSADPAWSQRVVNHLIDAIALLLPHLDQFTRAEWLLYENGTAALLGSIALQTMAYLLLLVGAALFDLYRKDI